MSRSNQKPFSPPAGNPPVDKTTTAAREPQWEELEYGSVKVLSFGYLESLQLQITGDAYDAYMPRIARNGDGLVPVLPIKDLGDGAEALLILPGTLHSWLRKNRPALGTRLAVERLGVNEATGAWRLRVARL